MINSTSKVRDIFKVHEIKAFPKIYSTGKGRLVGTTVQFFQPSPSPFTSVGASQGRAEVAGIFVGDIPVHVYCHPSHLFSGQETELGGQ